MSKFVPCVRVVLSNSGGELDSQNVLIRDFGVPPDLTASEKFEITSIVASWLVDLSIGDIITFESSETEVD